MGTITTTTLLPEEETRFRKVRGAMPNGALVSHSWKGGSLTVADMLDYLEDLCKVLTRCARDNERERSELDILRSQQHAIKSFLGLGEK